MLGTVSSNPSNSLMNWVVITPIFQLRKLRLGVKDTPTPTPL